MSGSLQAWKHCILSGLVFTDAIVFNGIIGNLMSILEDILGRNMAKNAAILAIQMGLSSLIAIAGRFLTDDYFGKYIMINISIVIYIIALVILCFLLRIEEDASIYVTCFLIAVGHGCFESLLEEYGKDQIDTANFGGRRVLHYVWWRTPKFLGSAVGSIILLIAEKCGWKYEWKYAGWLTTGVMVVASSLFFCSKFLYDFRNDKPATSPYGRVIRVFVAATLNIHLPGPVPGDLHEEEEHDHILPHSNSLRCLDKAAIRPRQEDAEKNKWWQCRVTEVEEIKCLLHTFPTWATLVMCGIVSTVQQTLFIEQAYYMERRLGSVKVPVTSLFMLAGLPKLLIDKFHPRRPDRIITLGIFFSILCCITAALVESRRLNAYNGGHVLYDEEDQENKHDVVNVSIFWLLPQFFLIGAMDGLVYSGIHDFFDDHLPDSMKSLDFSFFKSVHAAGYFLFALLATIMNKATKWFGVDINSSRVDYVYWGLGILSLINFFIYGYISGIFSPIREGKENDLNGTNNDNDETTTSAQGRTTTIEMRTVEQLESGASTASSEHV
ncbi:protein NRT1/ PTR FAMILY 5.6-like [Magnolia sinica]|uniref:protein NRT1/ PTR FAMILY 5.6-like n=1 Tax=Magnolia sinica TaxID=86752 RepID=UPI00265AEB74|nr:protein NRT1/ PTR FAMILY 5.6-like [Magnolia sinica]